MNEQRFIGKVAVVTGGASGMGFLFGKRFVEEGGSVVLCDVNKEALDAKLQELNAPEKAIGCECDVREYGQIKAACRTAKETFGSLDVTLAAAGGAETRIFSKGAEFPDNPIEIYEWSLDVNLRGQLYLAHAALPFMREQRSGVIINVGSITGEEGGGGHAVGYAAAKSGAMNGLTKSLGTYGAAYGVRCVCVSPGPVLTRPGMANMKTAIGRAAEPDEIIDLMLYLASDKAAFITGVNYLIDGGRNVMFNKS